jgi:hypothetical protein
VTAGTVKEAGLPNITGTTEWLMSGNTAASATGALYWRTVGTGAQRTAEADRPANLSIDASLSNPIYGNSTTVQPPALTTRYIIKAFDGQTADSALIDITQFENELGGKADRSLSNLTTTGLAKLVGAVSKSPYGYLALENGLIIQWGSSAIPQNYAAFAVFPIAFPTACLKIVGIGEVLLSDPNPPRMIALISDEFDRTHCNFRVSAEISPVVSYIAIGY